jgi:sn-glycerol 3-phosphate transport system substrate-binding protein
MTKLTRRTLGAAALALGLGAAGPALAQQKTEVRFYFPVAVGGPVTKIIDDYAAAFEKANPDIKVTPIYSGDYVQTVSKALTAIKGGDIPETAILLAADLFLLLGEDVIVPVSDVANTPADKAWMDGFFPAFLENSKYKGKIYSIPFQRSTPVLYWNKDAFKAAGLDPEKGPANWNEMKEMAKKLTKKDASGAVTQWGVQIPSDGNTSWLFSGMTTGNGVRMFNEDGNKVMFDDPRVIEAVNNWYALSNVDGTQPKGLISWGATPTDFMAGKAAMMWTTTGNLTNVRNNAKFPFGVAFLPGMKQPGAPTGGGNFYIFKGISKAKQDATLKFIKFMTEPERAADWSTKTGYVAVSPAAYETKILKDYVAGFPQAAVARDQLKHAIPELSVYENQRVMKILNDALQSVMTGARPADVALKAAQQEAERVLKDYK